MTAEAKIRALIADDEPLARENLRIRLLPVPDFTVIAECANGHETLAGISQHRPDVVFLDIQMPDLSGFEVIERLPLEIVPVIVFVTAYDRYALDAFRVHALDYLLKPFDDERFGEALKACRERIQESRGPTEKGEALYRVSELSAFGGSPGELPGTSAPRAQVEVPAPFHPDRLVIKARGRVFFLRTVSIDWVEADGDYARLHCGDRSFLLRRTMNEMESRLDPRVFIRVSRSAIVHLDRIRDLAPSGRGEYHVRLLTGAQVKLTRGYRARLESLLGDRL